MVATLIQSPTTPIAAAGTGGTVTCTKPAATSWLVAFAGLLDATNVPVFSTPTDNGSNTGWTTLFATQALPAATGVTQIWVRPATATDALSLTSVVFAWTHGAQVTNGICLVQEFGPFVGTPTVDLSGVTAAGTSTSMSVADSSLNPHFLPHLALEIGLSNGGQGALVGATYTPASFVVSAIPFTSTSQVSGGAGGGPILATGSLWNTTTWSSAGLGVLWSIQVTNSHVYSAYGLTVYDAGAPVAVGWANAIGAGLAPAIKSDPNVGIANATGAGLAPVSSIAPNPSVANAAGAGLNPSAGLAIAAGIGNATGAGLNPAITITALLGVANGAGAGLVPSISIGSTVGIANAIGAAIGTGIAGVIVGPTVGTATGAGLQPSMIVGASPGVANATGAGLNPAITVQLQVGIANATGAALNPASTVVVTAGSGSATGAGLNPAGGVIANPSVGLATGAGLNPQTTITAAALVANALAAALAPQITISARAAGLGMATGAGLAPSITAGASPGVANAPAVAYAGVISIVTPIGLATGFGVGNQPIVVAGIAAGVGTAVGAAYNASVQIFQPTVIGRASMSRGSEIALGFQEQSMQRGPEQAIEQDTL